MNMSDTLIWLGNLMIVIGVIVLVGVIIAWYLLKRLNDQIEEQLAELLEQAKNRIVPLEVEVDNNQYFIYNASDKSFICQGATAEQIIDGFRARCPDKNAYFASGDERAIEYLTQEILRIKGEVKE